MKLKIENGLTVLSKNFAEFDLDVKNGKFVTDCGANMMSACTEMECKRLACIAHGLHNLLVADAIGNIDEIRGLVKKCKSIFDKLKWHKNLLKDKFDNITSEDLQAFIELFEEEEHCPYEWLDYYNLTSDLDGDEVESAGPCKRFTKIKNSNATRWSLI